jgi:hypothetical protein
MKWDGLATVLNLAQTAAGAGGSGGCIGVSRLGQDPGPSCSTLPFCGRCSEPSWPLAMETMGPRPSKGHTGGRVVGGGWIFRELELSGHDPCGLQAHCEQGTGTCAKPRREVPRALGGCSGGQLGRPWLDDAGQDRLAGRLGRKIHSCWLAARRRRKGQRRTKRRVVLVDARGCSNTAATKHTCTTQHPTSVPTPPPAQPSSTTTTSLSYAHAQPRPS